MSWRHHALSIMDLVESLVNSILFLTDSIEAISSMDLVSSGSQQRDREGPSDRDIESCDQMRDDGPS